MFPLRFAFALAVVASIPLTAQLLPELHVNAATAVAPVRSGAFGSGVYTQSIVWDGDSYVVLGIAADRWSAPLDAGKTTLVARRFNRSGQPAGELQTLAIGERASMMAAARTPDGTIVIVWSDAGGISAAALDHSFAPKTAISHIADTVVYSLSLACNDSRCLVAWPDHGVIISPDARPLTNSFALEAAAIAGAHDTFAAVVTRPYKSEVVETIISNSGLTSTRVLDSLPGGFAVAITADGDGGYVVAWEGGDLIRLAALDRSGAAGTSRSFRPVVTSGLHVLQLTASRSSYLLTITSYIPGWFSIYIPPTQLHTVILSRTLVPGDVTAIHSGDHMDEIGTAGASEGESYLFGWINHYDGVSFVAAQSSFGVAPADANGYIGEPVAIVPLVQTQAGVAASDDTDLAVWYEADVREQTLFARRFARDGTPIEQPSPISLGVISNPSAATDGRGFLVTWFQVVNRSGTIQAAILAPDGRLRRSTIAENASPLTETVWTGSTYALVATRGTNMSLVRVSATGDFEDEIPFSDRVAGLYSVAIAASGDRTLVVWTYPSNVGDPHPGTFFALFGATGSCLAEGKLSDEESRYVTAAAGREQFFVGGVLHAQSLQVTRVSRDGTHLDNAGTELGHEIAKSFDIADLRAAPIGDEFLLGWRDRFQYRLALLDRSTSVVAVDPNAPLWPLSASHDRTRVVALRVHVDLQARSRSLDLVDLSRAALPRRRAVGR